MPGDLKHRLLAALKSPSPPSSDYDLNPTSRPASGPPLREAAVLIPIVNRPQGATVLLTKRASTLLHHPGQIAFPGGKVDEADESITSAALREAHEEIGLPSELVDVLGVLPHHETVTGFRASPVLSLVQHDFIARPNLAEVAEVFEAPLSHLMGNENYLIQSRMWRGQRRAYFTVPWGPYYIWGATARMLRALANRMSHAET